MATALQTDDPVTTISHLDISVQASELPPSPSQLREAITEPLDWAEDANSLPIASLSPPLHQPRNISALRSSKINPFSSLQHRSRRFTHFSHKSRRHHSHFNSKFFYSPHCNPFKPSQPHSHTKTYSHLNWESDPRLSDLTRSLKALGWIRAH